MPYTPPAGWIEALEPSNAGEESNKGRFHTRDTCEHIEHPDRLRPVDKPYSAIRCTNGADQLDTPTSGPGTERSKSSRRSAALRFPRLRIRPQAMAALLAQRTATHPRPAITGQRRHRPSTHRQQRPLEHGVPHLVRILRIADGGNWHQIPDTRPPVIRRCPPLNIAH